MLPSATCQSTRWRSLETNPWTGEELVCCSICRFFDCVINPFFAKGLEFPCSLTARPLRPKKNGQSEKDTIICSINPRGKNHKRPIFRGSTLRNFRPSSSGWVLWSYPGRLRRTRTPRKRRTGCHLAMYQNHPKTSKIKLMGRNMNEHNHAVVVDMMLILCWYAICIISKGFSVLEYPMTPERTMFFDSFFFHPWCQKLDDMPWYATFLGMIIAHYRTLPSGKLT